jgi:excisionase family DNA binding protein
VSEVTVKKWLRAGRLKGFKVNRLWRVSTEDLEKFINGS